MSGLDVTDNSMLIINHPYLFNVSGKELFVCPERNIKPFGGLFNKE